MNHSDEQLMLCYQKGDVSAFKRLYERHKDGLYRYFQRSVYEPYVAEELYQEVWLSVIKARNRYQVKAKFSTYLYQIAHNRLMDHYRKQYRLADIESSDDVDSIPSVEEQGALEQALITEQAVEQILNTIKDLPREQKEVFLLKEEACLSLADIAHITGENLETVKSRLRYAMAKLRQVISKHNP